MGSFINSINNQDVRTTDTTSGGTPLGTYAGTEDGRIYRFGLAGAVALAPGKFAVTPAVVANHQNRTTTGHAVDSYSVGLNIGATAATIDQYKDGYLTINDAAGEGITYLVEGNAVAAGSDVLTVALAEPIKVALTASTSEATLHVNPMASLIVSPSAIAHQVAGVNNVTVAIGEYAWFQVAGYCSVLSDGIIAKGVEGILSDAVAGAVETRVDATLVKGVCVAIEATVDTEYRTVNLTVA